jgi:hypothetical protein
MDAKDFLEGISRDNIFSSSSHLSNDIRLASRFFYIFIVFGIIFLLLHNGLTAIAGTSLLWALACLVVGAALGFLFGVPKIYQNSLPPGGSDSKISNTISAFYQQQVNTNLTEISDWLTK